MSLNMCITFSAVSCMLLLYFELTSISYCVSISSSANYGATRVATGSMAWVKRTLFCSLSRPVFKQAQCSSSSQHLNKHTALAKQPTRLFQNLIPKSTWLVSAVYLGLSGRPVRTAARWQGPKQTQGRHRIFICQLSALWQVFVRHKLRV